MTTETPEQFAERIKTQLGPAPLCWCGHPEACHVPPEVPEGPVDCEHCGCARFHGVGA